MNLLSEWAELSISRSLSHASLSRVITYHVLNSLGFDLIIIIQIQAPSSYRILWTRSLILSSHLCLSLSLQLPHHNVIGISRLPICSISCRCQLPIAARLSQWVWTFRVRLMLSSPNACLTIGRVSVALFRDLHKIWCCFFVGSI
jgi:hypothetical protein